MFFWITRPILAGSEIKRVASFKTILAFTDSGAYQVKVYDSGDKVVTVLVGSDQKGNKDGTAKVALLFNRKESALLGKQYLWRTRQQGTEANNWAVGHNTIPEESRSIIW